MQMLQIITAPLIGGIIGYITNYFAIKMLFRPLNPIMIGRFRVPFTPGIVPKRKDALAEILGRAIVDKFFNADDLEIVFTSSSFTNAFADSGVTLLTDKNTILKHNPLGDDKTINENLYNHIRDELCIRIQAAILRADLSRLLTAEDIRIIQDRLGSTLLGKVFNDERLSLITGPLVGKLEKYVLEEGRSVILPILDDELNALISHPLADITAHIFPDSTVLHSMVCKLYQVFMARYVRHIVESIDVGAMITEKVKLMSAGEVESLVLSVVNRELRYVVLLGAFVGMLIGAINIFI